MGFQQQPLYFDPNLRDVMIDLKRETMLELNCHAIAKVESFDSAKCTCQATILYSRSYFEVQRDGSTIQKELPYPPLYDMPVFIMGGGTSFISFPIKKDDEVLILFNDRDIDNWVAGAKSGPVNSSALHAFSDGIALIGFKKPPAPYDLTRARLQNNNTYVGVGDGKVKVDNGTYTLNGILQDILTQLKNLANTPTPAAGVTLNPTVAAQLTTLATQLGSLIE